MNPMSRFFWLVRAVHSYGEKWPDYNPEFEIVRGELALRMSYHLDGENANMEAIYADDALDPISREIVEEELDMLRAEVDRMVAEREGLQA